MLRFARIAIAMATAMMFFVGCGGSGEPKPVSSSSHSKVQKRTSHIKNAKKTVYVNSVAPYNSAIAPNIKHECKINTQVITWIKRYAAKQGIDVVVGGKPKADDLVLKIEIIDAISAGNAFAGHYKYVTISGKLYKGSKLQSSFKAARRSGGGYWGVYRSSCSVLGSCVKTLGKDTAKWLLKPTDGAKLGDVYLIK